MIEVWEGEKIKSESVFTGKAVETQSTCSAAKSRQTVRDGDYIEVVVSGQALCTRLIKAERVFLLNDGDL